MCSIIINKIIACKKWHFKHFFAYFFISHYKFYYDFKDDSSKLDLSAIISFAVFRLIFITTSLFCSWRVKVSYHDILFKWDRIEVLVMVGDGDKIRGYSKVCQLFYAKDAVQTISPSTLCKIVHKFTCQRSRPGWPMTVT